MKRNEIIVHEHKKGVKAVKYNAKPKGHIEPPKPRNPVAKNAGAAIGGGAAGAHKDAKKASQAVRGQKHKATELAEMDSQGYTGSRDDYKLGDPEGTGKAMKAKEFAKKALAILNKEEGDEEEWYDRNGRPDPNGAYDAGGHYHLDREMQEGDQFKRDFKRAELQHELGHERNNIQIVINGKKWKVFPGKGYADSPEERMHLRKMEQWASNKSAATGKKWEVYLTGANPSVDEGEGKVTASDPSKGVEITNPQTGVKTTIPPTMSSALAPDAKNPGRYTLNPQAVQPGDSGDKETGPKVGSQVSIPDQATEEDMMTPPGDSSSPIHGGEDHDEISKLLVLQLRKLAGL